MWNGGKMKHNVHLYATVRVKVKDIEAESHSDAMCEALGMVDINELFRDVPNAQGLETEHAEEITALLVDEVGDEDYSNSQYYEWVTGDDAEQEFRPLHPYDELKYVQRPYKDLDVPYELDEDVQTFLHELCRRFDVTFTGGCRAFYTAKEWELLGNNHYKAAAVIVHDGGDLSYLLNLDKCDSREAVQRYEMALALAEEHELWIEHLSCVSAAVYRKESPSE